MYRDYTIDKNILWILLTIAVKLVNRASSNTELFNALKVHPPVIYLLRAYVLGMKLKLFTQVIALVSHHEL